ncbi:MAG: hypothetical protein WD342_12010 [Verrucomicrobiales bacterium]
MKTFILSIICLGLTASVHAQIADDESSAMRLASACAASSGYPSSNYEHYGRQLAKTIAKLSPAAQARVFGNTPNASSRARARASEDSAVAQMSESDETSTANGENGTSDDSGGLLDAVSSINDFLFGTTESVKPIIGGKSR